MMGNTVDLRITLDMLREALDKQAESGHTIGIQPDGRLWVGEDENDPERTAYWPDIDLLECLRTILSISEGRIAEIETIARSVR